MNTAESTSSSESADLLGFAQELAVDYARSASFPLFSTEELARYAAELKEIFQHDQNAAGQAALRAWRARPEASSIGNLFWFQRIPLSDSGTTTTSDHSHYGGENPGPLNTLWGHLSPIEGTVLRPLPKWAYLKRVLPPLRGKTVLEIGTAFGRCSSRGWEPGSVAASRSFRR